MPADRFDHGRTRFALTGGHAKPACEACHFRPAPGRPVVFAGSAQQCTDCHADRHEGQFQTTEPRLHCGDCHKDSVSFKIARFDHTKTRFALDGRHQEVACARCHPDRVGPQGKATPFYRVGRMACEDCHKNPHNPTPRSAP
ncbi:MAG: hypothetical protein FJ100_20690 [Deltaproteobacteria bacterium]|nr:hypothetical protein [Deltaproteobacteria bacterium]